MLMETIKNGLFLTSVRHVALYNSPITGTSQFLLPFPTVDPKTTIKSHFYYSSDILPASTLLSAKDQASSKKMEGPLQRSFTTSPQP